MSYWDIKGFGDIINKHVAKMNERFPAPPHDARFLLRVSEKRDLAKTTNSPFRIVYEEEDDEENAEEEG